ncbi:uncharacterized protein [Drosophila takahashii]|uniref:uncharacterized protein isoform X2 n=1 Tax=Drosophila takahashii TaxID=29030 RepID=UPI0038995B2A
MLLSFADSRSGSFRTLQYYFMTVHRLLAGTDGTKSDKQYYQGTHKKLKVDAKQAPRLYKTADWWLGSYHSTVWIEQHYRAKEERIMQRIIAIVAILAMATGLSSVKAQTCQECQTDNDVYCHNQTAYQNCMKNAPIGDIVLCPTGTVCSNSDDVCVDSSEVSTTILDVCGSSGGNGAQCEVCSSKYACVSSTQYVRCSSSGVPVTSNVYSCGSDEICIIQSLSTFGSLCVPSCASEFVGYNASCSNSVYQPATTTAAPTTTPSATQKEQYCIAAEPTTSYSYFFARNTDDSTCTTYLYCQKSGTDWIALFMTCGSSTPFFDSATGKCVKTKPASCS